MKNIRIKKTAALISLTLIVWTITGHLAWAQGLSLNPFSWIFGITEGISFLVFQLAATFLTACGILLNVSIQLTTHLGVFIAQNQVIYDVWSTIRDLSSMLLIFFILWAAIQMILGLQQAQYKQLITSIIIAGILINFSFFFTRVLIDASNIVSLQFYNAIAPNNQITYSPNDSVKDIVTKSIKAGDGGLAGIFVGALGVNHWWNNKGEFKDNQGINNQILIILNDYMGALVEVLAGLSILAAALAAMWRTVILIFLLGFSAIWIASYAIPKKLDELSNRWVKNFQANLIFLPVYLAFLYVAVLIITKTGLNNIVNAPYNNPTEAYVQLFTAFGFIIVVLNVPLIAAIQVSGLSLKWVDKLKGSFEGFQKWATTGRLQWAGRNTFGQAAYIASKSDTMRNIAQRSPAAGLMVSKGLSKVGSGYEKGLKKEKKDLEGLHKKIGEVERSDYATQAEFDDAKKRAKAAQEKFREQLPTRSIFYGMMTSRGARETAAKLTEEANKKALLKGLKKDKNELEDVNKDLKDLDNRLERETAGIGFAPGKPASAEDLKRRENLMKKRTELEERIEKAEEEKENQSIDRIIKGVKDKGDGEEKKKDEKKEEKK